VLPYNRGALKTVPLARAVREKTRPARGSGT
jgi:hypothetical protein